MQQEELERRKHANSPYPLNELLLRRWSPRAFRDQPVSDADLKTLFSAASWAQSSYNEQPWRFLVGRKGDETYRRIFESLVPANQSWAKSAPVLFASFGKKNFSHNGEPNAYGLHDTGASTANLALQATALGLHVHGMGGFDKAKLCESFHVPDEFEPGACWALGYLGDAEQLPEHFREMETAPRQRKRLEEFVFAEWDKPAAL